MHVTPEKMVLVELAIETPCEYHTVARGEPACDRPATVGYLSPVKGRLGKCYCAEHHAAIEARNAARVKALA